MRENDPKAQMAAKQAEEIQRRHQQALLDRHKPAGDDKRGNAEVEASEVMDVDDLYDSERIAINNVMAALGEKMGATVEGSAFQREVRDRFAEIGFVVRCDLWKDDDDPRDWDERPWIPSITLVGRTEKQGEFDHERMGHEVRSNILGKNQQGNVQRTQVAGGFSRTDSGLIVPGS